MTSSTHASSSSLLAIQPDRITAELLTRRLNGGSGALDTVIATTLDEAREALASGSIDAVLIHQVLDVRRAAGLLEEDEDAPLLIVNGVDTRYEESDFPPAVDVFVHGDGTADGVVRRVQELIAGGTRSRQLR